MIEYSDTADTVLNLPGWYFTGTDGECDYWGHEGGTSALVWPDGTISTYPFPCSELMEFDS